MVEFWPRIASRAVCGLKGALLVSRGGIKGGLLVRRHRFRAAVRTKGGVVGRREWKLGRSLLAIEMMRGWSRSAGSWSRRALSLLDNRGS